jgi:mannose-6-phosphate isomerase-like protein (cupin superfamily)
MTHGTVIHPTQARSFPYAGQPMRFLAEPSEAFDGFSAAELTVPARFAGPVPHIHHGFDEGLYVLTGRLLIVHGTAEPVEATAGTFCLAPRGLRHTFSNPDRTPALVLGVWSPGSAGLAFMVDIGAAMPVGGAPDPATVQRLYQQHDSELVP